MKSNGPVWQIDRLEMQHPGPNIIVMDFWNSFLDQIHICYDIIYLLYDWHDTLDIF